MISWRRPISNTIGIRFTIEFCEREMSIVVAIILYLCFSVSPNKFPTDTEVDITKGNNLKDKMCQNPIWDNFPVEIYQFVNLIWLYHYTTFFLGKKFSIWRDKTQFNEFFPQALELWLDRLEFQKMWLKSVSILVFLKRLWRSRDITFRLGKLNSLLRFSCFTWGWLKWKRKHMRLTNAFPNF